MDRINSIQAILIILSSLFETLSNLHQASRKHTAWKFHNSAPLERVVRCLFHRIFTKIQLQTNVRAVWLATLVRRALYRYRPAKYAVILVFVLRETLIK